jgi:hypothetical protein
MEAPELFFGLCRYYSSLGLDRDISWSIWSQRTLSYFDQLGRMLGYIVETEDTLTDMENWKCPKALRGKRIDMTWIYPDRNVYALALEHQGSNNPKKIVLDIKKLSVVACPRILLVYRQNTSEVQKWIKNEIRKTGIEGGYFLVINIPGYFREKPPIEKLESRLADERGKLVAVGTAEARKERITGLRFFSNIKWFPKR